MVTIQATIGIEKTIKQPHCINTTTNLMENTNRETKKKLLNPYHEPSPRNNIGTPTDPPPVPIVTKMETIAANQTKIAPTAERASSLRPQ